MLHIVYPCHVVHVFPSTVPSLSDLPPSRRTQLERLVRQYMTTTKLSEHVYQQLMIFQQQYQDILKMEYDGQEAFPSAGKI